MNILAAVDQSDYASLVLKKAFDLATKDDAKVTVMTVSNISFTNLYVGETPTNILEKLREGVDETVKKIKSQAEAARTSVEIVVEESSSPANAIVDYAEKNGVDLIVIGSKGMGAIERFLIGSVSSQVVTHAPCSVLVVKK
ncbi:MAG: universal stress protein [Deltaproteobacteria bacterium]|nr:universal stress protein [Deltaproteobacteria bacterium]